MSDVDKSKDHEINEAIPAVKVLLDTARLISMKAKDYNATIPQSEYYPRGLWTILDVIHAKVTRARSVLGAMEQDPSYGTNFESLKDTMYDLTAYGAFGASWVEGGIPGQDLEECGLTSNRPIEYPVGGKKTAEKMKMDQYVQAIRDDDTPLPVHDLYVGDLDLDETKAIVASYAKHFATSPTKEG